MTAERSEESTNTNLARIRDNQRRSRARRKEYVSDLEERFRACQQAGAEANTELQAAARSVLEENKRLRRLLALYKIPVDGAGSETTDDQLESPAERLESLLSWRKPCQPGSSACQSRPVLRAHSSTPSTLLDHESAMLSTPSTSLHDYQSAQSHVHFPVTPQAIVDEAGFSLVPEYCIDGLYSTSSKQPLATYTAEEQSLQPQIWPASGTNGHPTAPAKTPCSSAADLIRTARPEIGYELEQDMGCQDGTSGGCSIDNTRVFDLMDKYSVG